MFLRLSHGLESGDGVGVRLELGRDFRNDLEQHISVLERHLTPSNLRVILICSYPPIWFMPLNKNPPIGQLPIAEGVFLVTFPPPAII